MLPFSICGWLSIACCLPYLVTLGLSIARLTLPDFVVVLFLWSIFVFPLAGAVLALIASIKRRWWLILAVGWIAISAYIFWSVHEHPIVI